MFAVRQYLRPRSLTEAVRLLVETGPTARPIAGGTDLVVQMQAGRHWPDVLVDLALVPDLGEIQRMGDQLLVGAAVTHTALLGSPLVRTLCPVLAEIARQTGSIQIQNAGTVGGNLANASPAADLALGLLALRASVRLVGADGERDLPVEQFFLGPGRTALRPAELLASVAIPERWFGCRSGFLKVGRRRAHPIAVVGVAAAVLLDDLGRCEDVSVALGAVAPTPVRASNAEQILNGRVPEAALIAEAARAAAAESRPIDDLRASAEYRRDMVEVLTRRVLSTTLGVGAL